MSYAIYTPGRIFSSLLLLILVAISGSGCSSDDRVSARSGMIAMAGPYRDANFTVELPDGWESAEYLPDGVHPGIRGAFYFDQRPLVYWILDVPESTSDDRFEVALGSEAHETWTEDVGDTSVEFARIKDPAQLASIGVGARFEVLPADSQQAAAPLFVYSPSIHYDKYPGIQDEILQIIRSVRHASLPEDGRPYFSSSVVPEPALRIEPLHKDKFTVGFSALVPEHWTASGGPGIDSIYGQLRGDEIEITYEFFNAGSTMGRSPWDSIMSTGEFPEHFFWEETIGNEPFYFYAPLPGSSGDGACVGTHIPQLPGSPYEPNINGIRSLGIFACDLTAEQKELVIAIIRSIRWTGDGA